MNYYFDKDVFPCPSDDYSLPENVRNVYAPAFGLFCEALKENHQAMIFEPSRSSFFGYDEEKDVWRTLNLYDDGETIQRMKNELSKENIIFHGNTLISYPRTFILCKMNHSEDVKDWEIFDTTTIDDAQICGNATIRQWINRLLPYADAHDVAIIEEEFEAIGYYIVCDFIITELDKEEGIIQP